MQIRTERLVLRPVTADDWRDIREIWIDQAAGPFARYDRPNDTDAEAVRHRIAKWAACAGSAEHLFWAVVLARRVIGFVSFNRERDGYEIGYCFHSAYHRKGYAKESLTTLLAHMREVYGAQCFTAGTALDNTPSVVLLTSIGFLLEGTEQVSFYCDEAGRPIRFTGGIFQLEITA